MVTVDVELCADCGREWPSRFGKHNCNFQRRYIHNHAIVVEPGAPLAESVQRLTERLISEAMRSAEYADLAGEENCYPYFLGQIDAAIGQLKRFRAELQVVARHVHEWNSDDYCRICGADGRA